MNKFKIITIFLILSLFSISAKSIQALSAVVSVPEKYSEVLAGDRVYFTVEIKYPENQTRQDLRLTYQIKKGDEVIAESKVLKAVETQASFIDYIVLPDDASDGIYTISVKINDYDKLNQDISATFKVKSNQQQSFLIYFYIILGAITVLGIVITVEIKKLKV